MLTESRYTDEELDEVSKFLRGAYISAATRLPSARRRDPAQAIGPELQRLRRQHSIRKSAGQISEADLDEIADAMDSPYALDFAAKKAQILDTLKQRPESQTMQHVNQRHVVAVVLLQSVANRLCAHQNYHGVGRFLISATSLGGLLSHLGVDPLFAPFIVWTGTKLRDFGVPVFCDLLRSFLKSKGV